MIWMTPKQSPRSQQLMRDDRPDLLRALSELLPSAVVDPLRVLIAGYALTDSVLLLSAWGPAIDLMAAHSDHHRPTGSFAAAATVSGLPVDELGACALPELSPARAPMRNWFGPPRDRTPDVELFSGTDTGAAVPGAECDGVFPFGCFLAVHWPSASMALYAPPASAILAAASTDFSSSSAADALDHDRRKLHAPPRCLARLLLFRDGAWSGMRPRSSHLVSYRLAADGRPVSDSHTPTAAYRLALSMSAGIVLYDIPSAVFDRALEVGPPTTVPLRILPRVRLLSSRPVYGPTALALLPTPADGSPGARSGAGRIVEAIMGPAMHLWRCGWFPARVGGGAPPAGTGLVAVPSAAHSCRRACRPVCHYTCGGAVGRSLCPDHRRHHTSVAHLYH
jgi:hypothetical protein